MAIPMNSVCAQCLMKRHVDAARPLGDDETATKFAKGLMEAFLSLPEGADSCQIGPAVTKLYTDLYGLEGDRYLEEKVASNAFAMERLPKIYAQIEKAKDPIYAALQLSILGNYLDFAALAGKVRFEDLERMLEQAENYDLSGPHYDRFLQELKTAKSFVLITDNAGEVVFDRVLAETIHRFYPEVNITFLVRGGPANNDALREDADIVGIPFPVEDSGLCVGGTPLHQISEKARILLQNADMILAKGMGNTESLYNCGLPVYYAFLVKCARFEQVFKRPHLTPMFVLDGAYETKISG
jgi:uncharacterized protein with ATP-grasp and redox domains